MKVLITWRRINPFLISLSLFPKSVVFRLHFEGIINLIWLVYHTTEFNITVIKEKQLNFVPLHYEHFTI